MIDLGQKYDSSCSESPSPMKEGKKSYPTLYFTTTEEMELPDEGVAKIKFRKVESSENVREPDMPKYSCEIEVQGIEVISSKETNDYDDEPVSAKIKKAMGMKKEMY